MLSNISVFHASTARISAQSNNSQSQPWITFCYYAQIHKYTYQQQQHPVQRARQTGSSSSTQTRTYAFSSASISLIKAKRHFRAAAQAPAYSFHITAHRSVKALQTDKCFSRLYIHPLESEVKQIQEPEHYCWLSARVPELPVSNLNRPGPLQHSFVELRAKAGRGVLQQSKTIPSHQLSSPSSRAKVIFFLFCFSFDWSVSFGSGWHQKVKLWKAECVPHFRKI